MSLDVSSIEAMVRELAMEKGQCLADSFVEQAQSNAPHRTGELAASISHSGVEDTGSSMVATATCGAEYGVYVEHGRGGESGLLAIELGGEVVIVESVGPAGAQPFWAPAVDAWSSIVSGCA